MIFCVDVKNYIKANFPKVEHFYTGTLDSKYAKSLCVYDLKGKGQQIAIGGDDTTISKSKSFTVLLHYGGFAETEMVAYELYDFLRKISNVEIGAHNVTCVSMSTDGPVNVGAGEKEIYERVIDFTLYYV